MVRIEKCSGISLSGLLVINGGFTNNTSFGGGFYIADSAGCTINFTVSGNKGCHGGGIYLVTATNNQISGTFISNSASSVLYGGSGGGIYVTSSYSNQLSGTYLNNYSSGGIYFRLAYYNQFNGTIISNTAGICGGGIGIDSSVHNTASGTFCYNLARCNGGGMIIQGGIDNTVSGTLVSNNAPDGGGIYFYFTSSNQLSGNITGNSAETFEKRTGQELYQGRNPLS